MEQGELEGMQPFDGVIEKLIRSGVVTLEDAMPYASNQNNLLLRLADFSGGGVGARKAEPPRSDDNSLLDMLER
jgi:twitching motility protein PilT